jgi:protein phosphatase
MRLDIAAQSDIGRRKDNNEDSYGVFLEDSPNLNLFDEGALLCVADGLGGHMGGEIASKLAVSMFKDIIKEEPPEQVSDAEEPPMLPLMRRYVELANSSVYRTNEDLGTGKKPMGTTLISAVVHPRKVFIVNVGDSRCYHIREGDIIARTEDHSWVDEQVKLGLMSKAEAQMDFRKNVVTRSVGTRSEVSVDSYTWHIVPGDWLMLCSDGLINMVEDNAILEEFKKGGSAAEIAARLVDLANENGGKDNVTVVLANISPSLFRLLFMRLRSFCRKQGLKLLWLILTAAAFVAGWFARGMVE